MLNRRIITAALAFILLLGLVSCGTQARGKNSTGSGTAAAGSVSASGSEAAVPDQGRVVHLGVLVWKYSDPYGRSVREAMKQYAGTLGEEYGVTVDLEMMDARGDMTLQERQADLMFAAGKDLIIINPADTMETEYLEELAKTSQIPVLFYNREPHDTEMIRDLGSVFIGSDAEMAGAQQAEIFDSIYQKNPYAIDRNRDGRIAYLMFEGENNNPEAIIRTENCIRTLMELKYDMDALAETQVADWDEIKAEYMMSVLLIDRDASEIEAVFCNNDAMAIGVIKALAQAGFNLPDKGESRGHVAVFGVDATRIGKQYIRTGQMDGTVLQDADAMGKAVICMALNKVLNGSYTEGTDYELSDDLYSVRIPCRPFTKENLK